MWLGVWVWVCVGVCGCECAHACVSVCVLCACLCVCSVCVCACVCCVCVCAVCMCVLCACVCVLSYPAFIPHPLCRHLVHGQHLSEALWPRVGDTDVYNEAAVRFLSLIPRVCQEGERKYYRSSLENMEDADGSKVDQASPVDPHTLQVSPATLNGAIAAPQGRSSPRLGRSKKLTTPTLTPKSKATPSATPTSQLMPLTPDNDPTLNGPLSEEAAYFHYLSLAHEEVEACARACRCWSSAYSSVVRDDRHQRADIQPQEGRQRRQTADVGLFLQAVLEKLGSLLSLPHQQAVLLCGLLSRLAQFPQPLLRSFLLRHRLVLKEGVPDLHEVRVELCGGSERVE